MNVRLSDEQLVVAAQVVARIAHSGQLDKAGESYIDHVERVAERVAKLIPRVGTTAEITAVAWLHDTLEDTFVDGALLTDLGFPRSVIEAVVVLTRQRGQDRADYYHGCRWNHLTYLVKVADVRDNLTPSRLVKLPDKDQLRLLRKYAEALDALGVDY